MILAIPNKLAQPTWGPQEDGVGKPGVLKLVKLLDVDLAGEALTLDMSLRTVQTTQQACSWLSRSGDPDR